jgi:hypothetical protein
MQECRGPHSVLSRRVRRVGGRITRCLGAGARSRRRRSWPHSHPPMGPWARYVAARPGCPQLRRGSADPVGFDARSVAGHDVHGGRPRLPSARGGARSLGQQSGLRDVRAPLRAATLSTEAPAATSNGSPTGRRERSRQGRSWSTTTSSSALPLLGCRKLVQLSSDDAPRQ